jgi:hypothetical protein
MTQIRASVTAATTRRVVQLMPRPTHHNSAHPNTTGMMISSCKRLSPFGFSASGRCQS